MEPTISRFILFLFVYVLFTITSYMTVQKVHTIITKSNSIKNIHATYMVFMMTLISIVFLYVFLRILTGNNYILLFMLIFAASITVMLISGLVWNIFGPKNIQWFGVSVWMDLEFRVFHPKLYAFLQLLSTLIFIAYPIYIGIGYFGDAFASPEWNEYVMHSTIAILVGMSWLSMVPNTLNVFLGKNVTNPIRNKLFLNQTVATFSMLLYIPLFISPSNSAWKTPLLLGEYFIFPASVIIAIAVYLIALVILPYAIGRIKHLRWMNYLNSQLDAILESAVSELTINKDISPLRNTRELIDRFHDQLDSDESLDLAEDYPYLGDDADKVILLGLDEFKKSDPRFIIMENITLFKEKVVECISLLESEHSDDKKGNISPECISMLKLQMSDLKNEFITEKF
jgi:hypothetical protein